MTVRSFARGVLALGILAGLAARACRADQISDNGKSMILGNERVVTDSVREIDIAKNGVTICPGAVGTCQTFPHATYDPNLPPHQNSIVFFQDMWLISVPPGNQQLRFLNPMFLSVAFCVLEGDIGSGTETIYDVHGTMLAKVASDPVATEACQAGDSYTSQ
jgi:hypothetical protein